MIGCGVRIYMYIYYRTHALLGAYACISTGRKCVPNSESVPNNEVHTKIINSFGVLYLVSRARDGEKWSRETMEWYHVITLYKTV